MGAQKGKGKWRIFLKECRGWDDYPIRAAKSHKTLLSVKHGQCNAKKLKIFALVKMVAFTAARASPYIGQYQFIQRHIIIIITTSISDAP